jgi:hypothetical protein
MKKWKSIAKWPSKTGLYCSNGDYITTDIHCTKEKAEAVCRLLKKEGFRGERQFFPLETIVEEIEDRPPESIGEASN